MTQPQPGSSSRGLHERAIAEVLRLAENQMDLAPDIEDVARGIGEPAERLRALFPDSSALMRAVAEQALVILIDTCTRVVVRADPDDPVDQFCALGEAYLDWACAHRIQFKMMSDQRQMDILGIPSLRRYHDAIRELMTRMLVRARDEGHLHPDENIDLLVLSSRSYGYGLARMVGDGRMAEWAPDRDPLEMAKILAKDFVRRMARSSQPPRPRA